MGADPFKIEIPKARLDDLLRRLGDVNWPVDIENDDWGYGVRGRYLRELVDYWAGEFDWRAQERAMNAWPHFKATVDRHPIHFLHARGVGPNPMPLVLTHGWPWTFWDFHEVIGPLTDPAAHGGDPADAFDVVVPSLPGFVFSTPLPHPGQNWWRTADLWQTLMCDVLGYERFAAHGGDWGALVTMQLGHKHADSLIGIHLSNAFPMPVFDGPRPWALADAASNVAAGDMEAVTRWEKKFAAHVAVHVLGPQTLAYAMHDSPVGLMAWMLERRRSWGDCKGDVESRFSKEFLCTTMSLFWLTDSFVSSVRYYREAANHQWTPSHDRMPAIEVPTGISLFRHDMPPGPIDWSEQYYNRKLFKVHESGGHFAAKENPQAVLEDIRETFRPLR
jgi:pimeloyl-ACP methyl ester carboxylesterase